jgi:hypothetical protein
VALLGCVSVGLTVWMQGGAVDEEMGYSACTVCAVLAINSECAVCGSCRYAVLLNHLRQAGCLQCYMPPGVLRGNQHAPRQLRGWRMVQQRPPVPFSSAV